MGFVTLPLRAPQRRSRATVTCRLGKAAAAAALFGVLLHTSRPALSDLSPASAIPSTKISLPASARDAQDLSRRNSRVTGKAAQVFTTAKKAADAGNLEEAKARYDELTEIAPTFAGGFSNRGNLEVASGDYSKAVQDYNRALELAPLASDTWVVYLNRGCVLNKLGDSEGALQDLNEALSLKPNDSMVLANRALIHASREKWELALSDYRRAVEKKPNNVEPFWLNYSLTLFQKGLKSDSLSILRRVANRYPEEPLVRAAVAVVLFDRGDIAEAETNWTLIDRPRPLLSRKYLEDHQWPPRAIEAMIRFKTLRE